MFKILKDTVPCRKTSYKWNNRYKQKGIEGLLDNSKRPHNTTCRKVTLEMEETIVRIYD